MKLEFLNHKIPPPVILLISGIAIWLLKNIAPLPIPYSIRAILGTLFIIFGFGLDIVGLLEFRKFQTTMNPLKPENASKIVQTGIYSKTRNPMYLGMVFILIGWSIITKASFGIDFPKTKRLLIFIITSRQKTGTFSVNFVPRILF